MRGNALKRQGLWALIACGSRKGALGGAESFAETAAKFSRRFLSVDFSFAVTVPL
jgi:hypothetical protein